MDPKAYEQRAIPGTPGFVWTCVKDLLVKLFSQSKFPWHPLLEVLEPLPGCH